MIIPTALPTLKIPPSRGITTDFSAPFSSAKMLIENGWHEQIKGSWVTAYAGADGQEPDQGVIAIMSSAAGSGWYPTPKRVGMVHFTTADGTRLTLTAANGETFLFNVATAQYLAADGSIIPVGPTRTSEPTATPSPL